MSFARILLLAGAAAVAGAGAGCAGSGPPAQAGPPAKLQAAGDWDDVAAAIWTGAARRELAVERIEPGPQRLEATLRTVRSEPVTVLALRSADGAVQLQAKWGRFGADDARAEALLEDIRRRLAQLEGRAWAPAR